MRQLTDAQCIDRVDNAIGLALDSFEAAYVGPGRYAPPGFLLLCCYLEFLGSLYSDKSKCADKFDDFVHEYLPAYDGLQLYHCLRCMLAHHYSIAKEQIRITGYAPDLHLRRDAQGVTVLSLESFYRDVRSAAETYLHHARTDDEAGKRLGKRIRKHGTLGDVVVRAPTIKAVARVLAPTVTTGPAKSP